MAKKRKKRAPASRPKKVRRHSTSKKKRLQVKKGKSHGRKPNLPNRKRISKKASKNRRKIPTVKKRQVKKKKAVKGKAKRGATHKRGDKLLRKKIRVYRGAKKTRLSFLDSHNVPHEAFILDHRVRIFQGEAIVGINAETLKKITNDFRRAFRRGIQLGRLFINYYLSRGRGKVKIEKTVSTPRMGLTGKDSYQDLLKAFNELVLHLYDFGSEQMDDPDSSKFRITVKNVVLELIHVDTGDTVS